MDLQIKQTQHNAIIRRSIRRTGAHHIPKACERSNGVLGIVVVPRNAVMVKEGKELLPVFLDSPLQRSPGLCRTMKRCHVGKNRSTDRLCFLR